ncbi:MAG: tetratricopeptide repeat protein, partial [Bacteroidota bacterium]
MKKLFLAFAFCFSFFTFCFSQPGRDEVLANSYFQNGEFDKAVELYQDLWEKNNNDVKFYAPLYKCLMALKKFDELEKVVKKQIKKSENSPQFQVDLGYMYSQIPNPGKAKDQYEKILKEMKPDEGSIRGIANAFESYRLYDYVIAVYEKGGKMIRNESYFSFELAQAYLNKGDVTNAVKFYLTNMDANPHNVQLIKNTIQSSREQAKLLSEMETQLYTKTQRNPNNEDYIDLLTWVYIQNKDFEGALVQMKALDRRKGENGVRVINIARMAQVEGDYTNAISGFEYVVSKGKDNTLYFTA